MPPAEEALRRLGGPQRCSVCKRWGSFDGIKDPVTGRKIFIREWTEQGALVSGDWSFFGCRDCSVADLKQKGLWHEHDGEPA